VALSVGRDSGPVLMPLSPIPSGPVRFLRASSLAACLAAAMALALTTAGRTYAQPRSPIALPSAARAMMERVVQVAPHVYAFHAPLSSGPVPLANEMLIEQSDGLVLVDAGKTRGAGQRLVALIRSVSRRPLKAVILTHWHQDHVLGLGPIREAWPNVRIIASGRTREHMLHDDSYRGYPHALAETGERDRARAAALRNYATQYGPNVGDMRLSAAERRGWADVVGVTDQRIADERGTYQVLPDEDFDDLYRIDDPVAPVEARFLGAAHTDGDIVVWAPRQRVVAAGDMVVAPVPYQGSHMLAWPDTLRALAALRPAIIIPGHGPVLHGTFYVERLISAMAAFRTMAGALPGEPRLTEEQVEARAQVEAQVSAFSGGDPWLAYWCRQYFPGNVWNAYAELHPAPAAARP
jgi:glyoxylase-like metal-dependent hydrolase (beta-lactamase superfamily II)